ncbi:hypothetical protein LENED_010728 [Lentinula edodes]|uniref:Uncharacterized protein n=1 Tax=Lentinula edodes TaxID=5353 RepID=A0A1Q3ENH1_LENED|nr:hypothetical protein LENED_010728 [Lentinula edodes]
MTSSAQASTQTRSTLVDLPASKSVPDTLTATPAKKSSYNLLTWLQRFAGRHETMVAGLEDLWSLFKRIAGDLPVPFLSAALEGVSFVEEKFSLNRKNAKQLKDLKEKLNRFVSTVNHYQGENAVKEQIRDNESY